ncbi:hypothetical protein [Woodsholea maritima]|uniref:hypothetical protein n=1 Tax=Woodsholea maritima TaxID=240237 RepID=UPI00036FC9C6|nr:hypothetical protein [Woodsholea maritima]
MTKAQFRKSALLSVLVLAGLSWIALGVAITLLDLSKPQLLALGLTVGLLTELAMWTGAVIGGWTIFAKRKVLFQRLFSAHVKDA